MLVACTSPKKNAFYFEFFHYVVSVLCVCVCGGGGGAIESAGGFDEVFDNFENVN